MHIVIFKYKTLNGLIQVYYTMYINLNILYTINDNFQESQLILTLLLLIFLKIYYIKFNSNNERIVIYND